MEIFDQFMALVDRDLVVDVNRLNVELRSVSYTHLTLPTN